MSPRTPLPQTIQIYLPQGDPAGIRMAEITTRTVRVFEVPRPLLRDFRDMAESKQVAVYFLFGSSSSGLPSCYIGQTGSVGERLKQHSDKKDFWDRALVAVSLTNVDEHAHWLHGVAGDPERYAGRAVRAAQWQRGIKPAHSSATRIRLPGVWGVRTNARESHANGLMTQERR